MTLKFILFLNWNKKAAKFLFFCQQEKRDHKIIQNYIVTE